MKLVHISDTHLGYGGVGLQRHVEDPFRTGISIRQQEVDIMVGFRQAIDRIIENIRPDLVIHSGDLFDHSHPTPQAVDFAMRQIRRLSEAGIPLVVVEGDHSSPRISGQGQVLRLLLHLPSVFVACDTATQIRLPGILIHAIPHRAVEGHVSEAISLDDSSLNILVAHGVADGYPFYNTNRRAASLPIRDIAPQFDYVALGHYHRFAQVRHTDRAFYAGSTAMIAGGDFRPGYRFGFNVVELLGGAPKVRREELDSRPMHPYGLHDAQGLSPGDILTFIEHQVEELPPRGAYCHVELQRLDPLTRQELPVSQIEALFEGHAMLSIEMSVRERTSKEVSESIKDMDPVARFIKLVNDEVDPPVFRDSVRELGVQLLTTAQEMLTAEDMDGDS